MLSWKTRQTQEWSSPTHSFKKGTGLSWLFQIVLLWLILSKTFRWAWRYNYFGVYLLIHTILFMFMCTCISCQPKSYMKYTSDPLSLNNMICDCHRNLKFKRPSNWSYNSYHMRFLTACSRSPEYRCVTILIIQFTSCDLENFKVSIYSTTTKMIIIHLLGMVCLVL